MKLEDSKAQGHEAETTHKSPPIGHGTLLPLCLRVLVLREPIHSENGDSFLFAVLWLDGVHWELLGTWQRERNTKTPGFEDTRLRLWSD